jgi:hypothetical protein
MAWEWSHTQEAYANAESNLHNLKDSEIVMIFAEWCALDSREDYAGGFNPVKYIRGMMKAVHSIRKYDRESMLDSVIWEKSSEQATCDNGGFNAWVCPYGCHRVSFDK